MEKEMATHSSVLAWRIPGTGKPGGSPSMGSHRVGHDCSDLAAAAAAAAAPYQIYDLQISFSIQEAAFSLWWWFSWLCRRFLVWCSLICLFFIFPLPLESEPPKKKKKKCWSVRLTPMCSSRFLWSQIFNLFWVNFVCGIRQQSNFTLLHVAAWFSWHHLLRRCSPLYALCSFVIN